MKRSIVCGICLSVFLGVTSITWAKGPSCRAGKCFMFGGFPNDKCKNCTKEGNKITCECVGTRWNVKTKKSEKQTHKTTIDYTKCQGIIRVDYLGRLSCTKAIKHQQKYIPPYAPIAGF